MYFVYYQEIVTPDDILFLFYVQHAPEYSLGRNSCTEFCSFDIFCSGPDNGRPSSMVSVNSSVKCNSHIPEVSQIMDLFTLFVTLFRFVHLHCCNMQTFQFLPLHSHHVSGVLVFAFCSGIPSSLYLIYHLKALVLWQGFSQMGIQASCEWRPF